MYSDELKLDYENNKLISDKKILLEKNDGSYIKADSMESDLKLEATRFENMKIKYYYDEEKKWKKIWKIFQTWKFLKNKR